MYQNPAKLSNFSCSFINKIEKASTSGGSVFPALTGGRALTAWTTTQLVPRGGWVKLVATVSVRTLNVKKNGILVAKITKIHAPRAKISKFCKNYYSTSFLSYFPNFKILLKNIKKHEKYEKKEKMIEVLTSLAVFRSCHIKNS